MRAKGFPYEGGRQGLRFHLFDPRQCVEVADEGFAVDHVGVVDDDQVVDALVGGEGGEVQGGLALLVELARVDDDDAAVVASC